MKPLTRAAWILCLAGVLHAAPNPIGALWDSSDSVSFYSAASARDGDDGDREGREDDRDSDDHEGDSGDDGDGNDGGDHDSGGDDGSGSDDGGGDHDGDSGTGSGGKGGKGGKGKGHDTDKDSDGDRGDKPAKPDKPDKSEKPDTTNPNNAGGDDTEAGSKGKPVAAKDKSQKKSKPVAKPAEQPVVETPVVEVPTEPAKDGGGSSAGDHRAGEVVGVGMTSADVATVSAMGFAVATPAAAIVTTPVVQILLPEGVDENDARAALAKALPGRRFGLNKVYSGYATATSTKAAPAKSSEGPPGADPRCTGDQCYGRMMIGWQAELESCQAGIAIGMIDTGIDVDHPAFAGGTIVVKSFSPQDAKEEAHGHATGVAALLVGNGQGTSPGLLPKARLVAADVFYVDGKHVVTDTASLLRALDWLDQAGVGIVNMSFSGPQDRLVAEAIDRMSAKGVVFVAAAGNNGPGAPFAYPAAYPNVVAVTAVDARMRSYVKANHGDYIDVAAPGVKIWTATAGGKSGYQSGTSFAVPFVTAALAAGSAYGQPDAADAWLASAGIDDIGDPGADAVFGRGLLKAPASCGTSQPQGGFLSAFVPERDIGATGTLRKSIGTAQR